MAKILFKGGEVNTNGDLPKVGSVAPNFTLVNTGLADVSLADYKGKNVVLSINPSLDTSVCAATARKFNTTLSQLANTVVLYITKDLPFAHNRFCTYKTSYESSKIRCFNRYDGGYLYRKPVYTLCII